MLRNTFLIEWLTENWPEIWSTELNYPGFCEHGSGRKTRAFYRQSPAWTVLEVRGRKCVWRTLRLLSELKPEGQRVSKKWRGGSGQRGRGLIRQGLVSMQTSLHFTRAAEDIRGILMSRVMSSVIKTKVIMTGQEHNGGREASEKEGWGSCMYQSRVRALKTSRNGPGAIGRTW